jgi:hypothetical protein
MASAFKRVQKRKAEQDLHEQDLSHDSKEPTNQDQVNIGSDNDSEMDVEAVPKSEVSANL